MLFRLGRALRGSRHVSILTRPYGRMLYDGYSGMLSVDGFNPHPPLRADAMIHTSSEGITTAGFQSSPALTGGCYAGCCILFSDGGGFNPHPPLRADAIVVRDLHLRASCVSILTRPYGRMLYPRRGGYSPAGGVSILTRPYGRMLLRQSVGSQPVNLFQSSPALTGGCYVQDGHYLGEA